MTQQVKVIDFLPERYRQATRRRRTTYWRGVVAALFVMVFAACAAGLANVQTRVRYEHQQVSARHAQAVLREAALKQKESHLAEMKLLAELVTFQRHPWPRSRIVNHLLAPLPKSMVLEKLHIVGEQRAVAPGGETYSEAGAEVDKSIATDLAELKQSAERIDVVVRLEGLTNDHLELHGYLQTVSRGGLFTSAEVEQIEALRDHPFATDRFTARVVVRSGWGLQGGPSADEPSVRSPPPSEVAADAVRPLSEASR